MSYTKLFASIVTSTIWTEDDKTRIVWITMLALANKHGEVQASIPGLARVAGVSVESCAAAIEKFLSPDPYSRTPDDEGRRIEAIDGGWALLNHGKYREMASKDEAREAEAKRKRRYRAKLERNQKDETSQNVRDMSRNVPESRHIAEAKADTDSDPLKDKVKLLSDKPDDYPEIIKTLWSIFPAKSRDRSSKAKLADQWRKLKAKPDEQTITESLTKWASCHEWTKDGGQFAPGAHLWIKERKWESDPESVATNHREAKKANEYPERPFNLADFDTSRFDKQPSKL
jgi:hypothetical protein